MIRLRQMAWSVLAGGLCAGVVLFALQSALITPIIREAERYENQPLEMQIPAPATKPGEHTLPPAIPPPAPPPAKPTEYSILFTTLLADLAVGLGYALFLCAGFLLVGRKVDFSRGMNWGACGFAAFAMAPAFGLPPEPPGASDGALASLGARQLWWLLTVGLTIVGLATFAFARRNWKFLSIPWFLAPHLALAPLLLPQDAGPGTAPAALAGGFLAAVMMTSAAFWLSLGTLSGWVWGRLEPPMNADGHG